MRFINIKKRTVALLYTQFKHSISTNTIYNLTNYRSLIKLKGQDTAKYLQNLITNNVYNLNNENAIYSMILNNRGRILYDIIIYANALNKQQQQPDEYLIEIDSNYTDHLIKYLNVFKLRKKIEINKVDDELKLFVTEKPIDHHKDILTCSQDPRCSNLGYRVIIKNESDLLKDFIASNNDIKNYKINLYKNGIAENHQDISYSTAIPLEYNLAILNGVSFDKGCYMGQELVAKTHHTGIIRKRIMPIELIDNNNSVKFDQDSPIINVKTEKQVGKLRNLIDKYGIAMLRIAEIDNNNLALLDSSNKRHLIKFKIPHYWNRDENLIKSLNYLN
jgi:folate-binding protein YgfZ